MTDPDWTSDRELGTAIDHVMEGSSDLGELKIRILAGQERLRRLSSPEAWIAYLDLEESVNERLVRALLVIARWSRSVR